MRRRAGWGREGRVGGSCMSFGVEDDFDEEEDEI